MRGLEIDIPARKHRSGSCQLESEQGSRVSIPFNIEVDMEYKA